MNINPKKYRADFVRFTIILAVLVSAGTCLILSANSMVRSGSSLSGHVSEGCCRGSDIRGDYNINFGVTPDDSGNPHACSEEPVTEISTQYRQNHHIVFGSAVVFDTLEPPKPSVYIRYDVACPDSCRSAAGYPLFNQDWWCQFVPTTPKVKIEETGCDMRTNKENTIWYPSGNCESTNPDTGSDISRYVPYAVDVRITSNGDTSTIWTDEPSTFDISIRNDGVLMGVNLCFVIWSPDGATWTWEAMPEGYGPDGQGTGKACVTIVPGSRMHPPASVWDGWIGAVESDVDEVSPDIIGFAGMALLSGGMPAGGLEPMLSFNFTAAGPDEGEVLTLCIDDAWVSPNCEFIFVDAYGTDNFPDILWPPEGRCWPVKKLVIPQPTIQLDPTSIETTAIQGATPPTEQITVTNIGGGILNWAASNQAGWISLNPTSGTGNGTITVSFDLTGLAPGEYHDTVTVSDPDATNSPQITTITLFVESQPLSTGVNWFSAEICYIDESIYMAAYDSAGQHVDSVYWAADSMQSTKTLMVTDPLNANRICFVKIAASEDPAGVSADHLMYGTYEFNLCPEWDENNPVWMIVNHCESQCLTLQAADPEDDAISFGLSGFTGGGIATVTDNGDGSCELCYTPVAEDVGSDVSIEVELGDAYNAECAPNHVVMVTVDNNPAIIIECPEITLPWYVDDIYVIEIEADDPDPCDLLMCYVTEVPDLNATWDIDPESCRLTYQAYEPGQGTICIAVWDGIGSSPKGDREGVDHCCYTVSVIQKSLPDSSWSEPENFGELVNTPDRESSPYISLDMSTMVFASDGPGGYGSTDIWTAFKDLKTSPWGDPENAGSFINTEYEESYPFLSPDMLILYFASTRPGGNGGYDIYRSTRESITSPWQSPESVGPIINSASDETRPFCSPDMKILFFSSDKSGGFGGGDIYKSIRASAYDQWGEPLNIGSPINTEYGEWNPSIASDGLTLFFESNDRFGGNGQSDIWMAVRDSIGGSWSIPTRLEPPINVSYGDYTPTIDHNGSMLLFGSDRPGGQGGGDLWTALKIPFCGNANGDGEINIADGVFIINYVFKNGPPPDPEETGDANCDATINVGDAVYLINYVFKSGPAPCSNCP